MIADRTCIDIKDIHVSRYADRSVRGLCSPPSALGLQMTPVGWQRTHLPLDYTAITCSLLRAMTKELPPPRRPQDSVAALLYPECSPGQLEALEEYRVVWERRNGPTDLTRYYTSRWPKLDQAKLYKASPAQYYHGLPPFVRDFILRGMEQAAREGSLDRFPDEYIELFCSGEMKKGRGPHR